MHSITQYNAYNRGDEEETSENKSCETKEKIWKYR